MATAAFFSTFSCLSPAASPTDPLLLLQVLHFYFNAEQKGNSPTQFKEETTSIDFPEEVGNPLGILQHISSSYKITFTSKRLACTSRSGNKVHRRPDLNLGRRPLRPPPQPQDGELRKVRYQLTTIHLFSFTFFYSIIVFCF